jgi:hypothetical protein
MILRLGRPQCFLQQLPACYGSSVVRLGDYPSRIEAIDRQFREAPSAAWSRAKGEGKMKSYNPGPNLPDDVSIVQVRLRPSTRRALVAAGLKTVGDVRKTSDLVLLSIQNLGKNTVARLRNELGRLDRNTR